MAVKQAVQHSHFGRWAVVCLLLVLGTRPLQAAGLQTLHGHIPKGVARATPIGRMPPAQQLNLAIGLPLRDPAGLDAFLQQVYDPAHPNFRRYLTPEQFGEQFGPSAQDYQAVVAFAKAHGLKVTGTYPNRLIVSVSGSVADIEKTLHVNLRTYKHPDENRTFFAPDTDPSLDITTPLLQIGGLNNYSLPRPKSKVMAKSIATPNASGSGPNGRFLGNDFRAAYVPGTALTGAGQTVGLLEFDGYYANDITAYTTQAGYSPVPLQNILLDGVNGVPGFSGNSDGELEVALDIEMAIAMAPGLSKVVVFEGKLPNTILNSMATNSSIKQLSCSWGWAGSTNLMTDLLFKEFAAQGQSFFDASGDSGAYPIGSDTGRPNDSPYITIVGGTTLTTSSAGGAWLGETAWNWGVDTNGNDTGSSGGISTYYTIPTWQQGISMTSNKGSTTMRNIPDVSLTADNIWVAYGNGSSGAVGGTSCAAPLWAGYMALINQLAAQNGHSPAGFINPAVYSLAKGSSYSSYFHDISSGNNTNQSSSGKFFATANYDLCTGWGTPTVNLISALAIPDSFGLMPESGFSAVGPPGGPFSATAQTFTLTNSGGAAFSWSVINTSSWLSASVNSGTIASGNPGVTVTASLNTAASNLAAGTYSATLLFSNQTSQAIQSRLFTLSVGQSIVVNGSFEDGDLAVWLLNGSSRYNFVTTGSRYAKSGSYGLAIQQFNSSGTLSQTISTVPGQPYLLSLWLDSPDGQTPNQFSVSWNGTTLFSQTNIAKIGWTNLLYIVNATSNATLLQFGFRNDPSEFGLDNIQVVPIVTPVLQTTNFAISSPFKLTWNASTGLVYQLQYRTNLLQTDWINVGSATTATTTTMSLTDTPGTNSPRFYRVLTLP